MIGIKAFLGVSTAFASVAIAASKPNIVFLLTDDQDQLLDSMRVMPKLQALVADQGATMEQAICNTPVCCPSRSTIVSGRYIHSVGVTNNSVPGNCNGEAWRTGPELYTFGTIMQAQGYRTFYSGKYLNQYGEPDAGGVEHVPPGWDMWAGLVGNSRYYDETLSINGKPEKHGDNYQADYLPNLIYNKSIAFIQEATAQQRQAHAAGSPEDAKPFFAVLSVPACHQPADPAPQYAGLLPTIVAPRTPNYNTKNEDSHWFERVQGVTGPMDDNAAKWTDLLYRRRLLTLMTIDDIVGNLDNLLVSEGVWNNTFFFYTADNGYHLGQNGLGLDKRQPWETDLRIPTFVRGPGIPAGIKVPYQVGHVDIAATFADMAGVSADEAAAAVGAPPLDGESMLPKIHMAQAVQEGAGAADAAASIRQSLLFEYHGEKNNAGGGSAACSHLTDPNLNCYEQQQDNKPPFFTGTPFCSCQDTSNNTYEGMRSHDPSATAPASSIYTEFVTGFKELYDVQQDMWQTNNMYKQAGEQKQKELATALALLKTCEGPSCGRSTYPSVVLERAKAAAEVAAAAAAAGPARNN